MQQHLTELGWTFERVQGPEFKHSAGFMNRGMRACWHGHEMALRLALLRDRDCLILEDDIVVRNRERVEAYIGRLPSLEWDAVLFYAAERLERIKNKPQAHAYMVRRAFIPQMLEILQRHRREFQKHLARDATTFYDVHTRWLQRRFRWWGTEELIVQDRERFGSDSGWGWQGKQVIN